MAVNMSITNKGRMFFVAGLGAIVLSLCAVWLAAYTICADSPGIAHIADKHVDSLSNGLMTYASISVGFILTEFALLLTFSSSAFFANWRRSGKFLLWQAVNLLAVFSSLAVLVSSFVLLGWESTLPFVMGILAVNVVCMVLVFTPLLVVAGGILREGEQL